MLSLDLALDASSVINLIKGGVATKCLSCLENAAHITPSVQTESRGHTTTAVTMKCLVESGLVIAGDEIVTLDALNELMLASELGAGECETILYAQLTGRIVSCDDKRARNLVVELLGENRLVGTLKLMKMCVGDGAIGSAEAHNAYTEMKNQGAFLPDVPEEYFVMGT